MSNNCSIMINTISGGIVNFGGAIKIAPVSITKTTTGSVPSTSGQAASGQNPSTSNVPGNIIGALDTAL